VTKTPLFFATMCSYFPAVSHYIGGLNEMIVTFRHILNTIPKYSYVQ